MIGFQNKRLRTFDQSKYIQIPSIIITSSCFSYVPSLEEWQFKRIWPYAIAVISWQLQTTGGRFQVVRKWRTMQKAVHSIYHQFCFAFTQQRTSREQRTTSWPDFWTIIRPTLLVELTLDQETLRCLGRWCHHMVRIIIAKRLRFAALPQLNVRLLCNFSSRACPHTRKAPRASWTVLNKRD